MSAWLTFADSSRTSPEVRESQQREIGAEQAIVPLRDRVAVGLGAAFAVNCLSSLEGYIKSAEAAGVTDQGDFGDR